MFRILIAEDDPSTARLLCAIVKRAGYEPLIAADGVQALELLDHNHIDLLLCDVMMPRMDGFTLTRTIRESGSMLPILMLTAKDMPQDKHTGFIVGTDDYMTKPPDRQELVLRIKALLRRARIVDEHRITIGDVELDYDTHTVRRGHDAQVLPPKEFNLLYKLLAYPERTFTRLELLDEIWGMDSESDDKTVNVHINRLRTRFQRQPHALAGTRRARARPTAAERGLLNARLAHKPDHAVKQSTFLRARAAVDDQHARKSAFFQQLRQLLCAACAEHDLSRYEIFKSVHMLILRRSLP